MELLNFKKKYEIFQKMLFKICMIHLKYYNDILDVLQNAFVKLICESPLFNDSEYEKRWLIRVAINECKNYQKSFWKREIDLEDEVIVTINDSFLTFSLS